MSSYRLLVIVALGQGVALATIFVLILAMRWRARRRARRLEPQRAALDRAISQWAMANAPEEVVLSALSRLPPAACTDALVAWTTRVPGDRWRTLAQRLAQAAWARRLRSFAHSRWWSRRLDAARFLSAVATPDDVPTVARLIGDPQPAVQLAAVAAAARLGDPALVRAALDRVPTLTPSVVAYYAGVLKEARAALVPLLGQRLRPDQPALAHYAEFAARLGDPGLRRAMTALAQHPNVEVRIQVARALGGYPHIESQVALASLITDPAWQVRAQAARSFGRLADPGSLDLLRTAVGDEAWWVRLRAALALTRLGPPGLRVLVASERSPRAAERDMARLIMSLPPPALAEFAA